ncbi:hypothetical protein L226DRAFT_573090 [Lentinus tigrinus ALCF2SS1-7]|uniref:uncharacterized protein n=1 Tax=Lentinus tigrinus ALCF2SS1-7 TaxID=1328758 RepID=UPI0011660AA5|nr:hypothetical protein L226DRAFT_573090 [Lentinus tigrinus ALCF2SS1-7]
MNYRLHAFVFAGGMEVKVGNLNLHEGPSSGAVSTSLQMVTNDGNPKGLFRGVIMSSSSPAPTRDITNLQPYYDTVVEHAVRAGASDTLESLRRRLGACATRCNLHFACSDIRRRVGRRVPSSPPGALMSHMSSSPYPLPSLASAHELGHEDQPRSYVHQFVFPRALSPLFKLDLDNAPMYKRTPIFPGSEMVLPRINYHSSDQSDFGPVLLKPDKLADYTIQVTATQDPNGVWNQTIAWPEYGSVQRKAVHIIVDARALNQRSAMIRCAWRPWEP